MNARSTSSDGSRIFPLALALAVSLLLNVAFVLALGFGAVPHQGGHWTPTHAVFAWLPSAPTIEELQKMRAYPPLPRRVPANTCSPSETRPESRPCACLQSMRISSGMIGSLRTRTVVAA